MKNKIFIFFLICIIANILFVNAEEEIISYNDAVERIISNSLAISDIETRLAPMRDRLSAMRLVLSWLERFQVPETMPQGNRELSGELHRLNSMRPQQAREDMIKQTEIDIIKLRREIEALELQQVSLALSAENQLRNTIFSYIDLKNSIEIQKSELIIEEENLNHTTIRHSFGLVSRNALELAEINLNQSRLRLEESILNLNATARNLSNLLYLDHYINIEIDIDILFEENTRSIETSPNVRILQIEVNNRNDELQRFLDETRRERERRERDGWPFTTAENREISFRRGELEYHLDRATTERDILISRIQTALFNGIDELENLITSREQSYISLERAEHELETAELELSLGRITEHSLNQIILNIQRINQRIERTNLQIWLLIFRLNNPSLL